MVKEGERYHVQVSRTPRPLGSTVFAEGLERVLRAKKCKLTEIGSGIVSRSSPQEPVDWFFIAR